MAKTRSFHWPVMGFATMAYHSTMLAFESHQVIALRLTKMALGGPDAHKEAELMVSEKLAAMSEGAQMMVMGSLGGKPDMNAGKVMQLYRGKVRANRRRLSV